jgi:drug/metabolite transporter (DMT)-like permease
MKKTAVLYALASAVLFGASTPAAKVLVGSVHPAILAGLLYCGAGVGIAVLRRLRTAVGTAAEAPLSRSDWPWLGGAIVAGGVAGPLLLMWGLARAAAAEASLLLTLEGAATALIAWQPECFCCWRARRFLHGREPRRSPASQGRWRLPVHALPGGSTTT